jgi:uncharacterized protein (TIGR00730 family)
MHERKKKIEELSHAFVALPGGFGTLDEISEMLTWAQLGYHEKPCFLLNLKGFFDSLIRFIDHAFQEGFIRKEFRSLVLPYDNADLMMEAIRRYPGGLGQQATEP